MNDTVQALLQVAQGPFFRFAFTLMVLGLLRMAALRFAEVVAAYVTIDERAVFWHKLRQRFLWFFFPTVVLRRAGRPISDGILTYHVFIGCASLVFRCCALALPAFMVAHVYLWERSLGVGWPTLAGGVADALSIVTLVSGLIVFLSRLYSPMLRKLEPAWSFFKPAILLLPFATGFIAMHPTWTPLDYHVVLLLHVLSACVVFVMIPFGRLLSVVHTPLIQALPEAAWDAEPAPPRVSGSRPGGAQRTPVTVP